MPRWYPWRSWALASKWAGLAKGIPGLVVVFLLGRCHHRNVLHGRLNCSWYFPPAMVNAALRLTAISLRISAHLRSRACFRPGLCSQRSTSPWATSKCRFRGNARRGLLRQGIERGIHSLNSEKRCSASPGAVLSFTCWVQRTRKKIETAAAKSQLYVM